MIAGALVIHGLSSIDAGDAVRVLPGIMLGTLAIALARGAWTRASWGWTLGVIIGTGTIAYLGVILAVEWSELMRDASPITWASLLVIIAAAVALSVWFRPSVRSAFLKD